MIVRSHRKLDVPSVLVMDYEEENIATGHHFSAINQPFKILREATFEEYVAECIATIGPAPEGYVMPTTGFFYEVHTD